MALQTCIHQRDWLPQAFIMSYGLGFICRNTKPLVCFVARKAGLLSGPAGIINSSWSLLQINCIVLHWVLNRFVFFHHPLVDVFLPISQKLIKTPFTVLWDFVVADCVCRLCKPFLLSQMADCLYWPGQGCLQ